jgi:hypothetical protein
MLSAYASTTEPDNTVYEPIITDNKSVSFISRISRLLSAAFGASNSVVYTSNDAYNNV